MSFLNRLRAICGFEIINNLAEIRVKCEINCSAGCVILVLSAYSVVISHKYLQMENTMAFFQDTQAQQNYAEDD